MTTYPAPITRAVEVARRHFPTATDAMDAALDVLLEPLLPADDSPRWRLSLLTDGGFPFEVGIASSDDGPRYTIEVGPRGTPPELRLERAREMLSRLEVAVRDESTFHWLTRLQNADELRYGAWIGARHRPESSAYKIYAEVSPAAEPVAITHLESLLGRPLCRLPRRQHLRMIGWYPATDDLEFYFEVTGLRPWELNAFMAPIGLDADAPAVMNAFEALRGRPFGQRLPAALFGFSYVVPGVDSAGPAAFSFFGFTEHLLGEDPRAHQRLLGRWLGSDAQRDYYAELSAPTSTHIGRWNHHGLLGVTVHSGAAPVLHIGLRPPAAA